ncbi:MAG: hypothetical protein IIX59_08645 [Alistipes sp.]|nr:hypothetical protein [Alistipes sp.]
MGWEASSWNVEFKDSYVQLGGVMGSGSCTITSPSFHVPADFKVKVDVSGYIRALDAWIFGWRNTTFSVSVGGTKVEGASVGSDSQEEHPMAVSGTGKLTTSNPKITCNSSYEEAGPYAKVSSLRVTYN